MMQLQPPATLLVGPSGSGKTSALATYLLAGIETGVICTEPGGVESLLDSVTRLEKLYNIKNLVDKLHWVQCPPAAAGWTGLEAMLTAISTQDQQGIASTRDMGKADFRPAAGKFLNAFKNFTCERTGQVFGDVTTWLDNMALCVDSLSGWSAIAWGLTVGFKPTASPGEWGIGQNVIHSMLTKINSDRKCFFTLTAHVEKEMDDISGVRRVMVSTIGAKLAPKIPPFFSEVVRCARGMDAKGNPDFTWSTLSPDMDLKNRALPIGANLRPDFKQIVDAYVRRKTLAMGTPQPVASTATAAVV